MAPENKKVREAVAKIPIEDIKKRLNAFMEKRRQTKSARRHKAAIIGHLQLVFGGLVLFLVIIMGLYGTLLTSYAFNEPDLLLTKLEHLGVIKNPDSLDVQYSDLVGFVCAFWMCLVVIFFENVFQIYAASRLLSVCEVGIPSVEILKGIRFWETFTIVSTVTFILIMNQFGLPILLIGFLLVRIFFCWHVMGYKGAVQFDMMINAKAMSAKFRNYGLSEIVTVGADEKPKDQGQTITII